MNVPLFCSNTCRVSKKNRNAFKHLRKRKRANDSDSLSVGSSPPHSPISEVQAPALCGAAHRPIVRGGGSGTPVPRAVSVASTRASLRKRRGTRTEKARALWRGFPFCPEKYQGISTICFEALKNACSRWFRNILLDAIGFPGTHLGLVKQAFRASGDGRWTAS